jgi:hypothetical protein
MADEYEQWWEVRSAMQDADDPFVCERCGADDSIAGVGRRQLCTACRQALDLCTLCAAPALSGDWWCPDCDLIDRAFDERVLI